MFPLCPIGQERFFSAWNPDYFHFKTLPSSTLCVQIHHRTGREQKGSHKSSMASHGTGAPHFYSFCWPELSLWTAQDQEARLNWKCDFLPRRTWNHKNKIQPASAFPSPTSTVQPTSFFSRFSQNILCRNCFLWSLTQTGRHGYWVGLLWLHRLTEAEL